MSFKRNIENGICNANFAFWAICLRRAALEENSLLPVLFQLGWHGKICCLTHYVTIIHGCRVVLNNKLSCHPETWTTRTRGAAFWWWASASSSTTTSPTRPSSRMGLAMTLIVVGASTPIWWGWQGWWLRMVVAMIDSITVYFQVSHRITRKKISSNVQSSQGANLERGYS